MQLGGDCEDLTKPDCKRLKAVFHSLLLVSPDVTLCRVLLPKKALLSRAHGSQSAHTHCLCALFLHTHQILGCD